MAKKINPGSLTVDYKQLMRMPISQRLEIANSGFADDVLRDITPTQLAQAFPKYYQRALPDIGKIVSAGGSAAAAGLPGAGGGGGGTTATPVPSAPSGRQNPQSSQETRQDSFLAGLRELRQQKTNINPSGLTGGSTIPKGADKETISALNEVASRFGLKPESISMMINLESRWNTKTGTGSYTGLTQIGPATFREAKNNRLGGLTWDEYKNASPAEQIRAYGDWLQHYKFSQQLEKHGINLSSMPANIQAAYLQGMQFAPNSQKWKEEFASGNYNYRTTETNQARALGSTSISDMAKYYENIQRTNPGQYDQRATQPLKPGQQIPSQSGSMTGLKPGQESSASTGFRAKAIEGQATSEADLYGIAISKRPDSRLGKDGAFNGSNGNCGRGTGAVVDAIFGTNYTKGGIGDNAKGFAGRNAKPFIPKLYSGPQGLPEGYLNDPSQWRIGDVIAAQGGSGNGHIQVWNGKQWTSDFKQKNILTNGYYGHTLHRVKPEEYSRVTEEYAKNMDQGGVTRKYLQDLGIQLGTAATAGVDNPGQQNRQHDKIPSDYDSWPKSLRDYLEKNPDAKKEFLDAHAVGVDVLKYYNEYYAKNPKFFEQNPEATASVVAKVVTAPPGEVPKFDPELIPNPNQLPADKGVKPFERVLTHISGYSGDTKELEKIKGGKYDTAGVGRATAYGYHTAIASSYVDKDGNKITEKQYAALNSAQKQAYTEKAELHEIRPHTTRPWQAGPLNATSYGLVTVGEVTPAKIAAAKEHLAKMYAAGQISKDAIRNTYGHGELQTHGNRATLDKGKTPEGSPLSVPLRGAFEDIIKRGEEIKAQQTQAQSTVQAPTASPVSSEQYNTNATEAQTPYVAPPQANQGAGISGLKSQESNPTKPPVLVGIMGNTKEMTQIPETPEAVEAPAASPPPADTREPEQMAYGDTGRLPPTGREPIQLVSKGKVLADVSPGEMIKAPSFGTNKPEVVPEPRIRDVRAEQQNNPQNMMNQPEQPMQQPQNMAGMTSGATQLPPSNINNDTNKIYEQYMEPASKIDTASNAKAFAYAGFKDYISDNYSNGINRMNTGFNTLTG
jgi:hypothetical protein